MVSFSIHAGFQFEKIERFSVSKADVLAALESPDLTLEDSQTGNLIAINGRAKIAVIYAPNTAETRVVTIIYSTRIEDLVRRRRRSGRWVKR